MSGEVENPAGTKVAGFLLSALSLGLAVTNCFILRQTSPLLGPDGALLVLGTAWLLAPGLWQGSRWQDVPGLFCALTSLRELWGWIRVRSPLDWCLVRRLAGRCKSTRGILLLYCGALLLFLLFLCMLTAPYLVWLGLNTLVGLSFSFVPAVSWPALIFCLSTGGLWLGCLWQYGGELAHFQAQVDRFQQRKPIQVRPGAFAPAEAQLQQIRQQNEEAVRQAVASERFKVELIANVSHDLRTPLTSILGYGELLQQETLSPEGAERLARLGQKAGYMRDLVESLFELTKVSSGVVECKKEPLDLIKLLEQTIGLFDDQLSAAGLQVRRHYDGQDRLPLVTDGARMHQVFANLLGNAMKYALPGTRIHLEVREEADNVLIRMVNTASYEMDFQPEEVLQRFARGDKARTTQGSGIGLAIAQTYTQSVGGEFSIAIDGDQFSAMVRLPKTERNM